MREALAFMAENIRTFHEAQKPEEMWFNEIRPGVFARGPHDRHPVRRLLHPARQGRFPRHPC